ncbi:MAG: hypothetical protein ACI8VC_001817 [Candidatus Endobugula sp.]|jgi:hypothetical protein
MTKKLFILLFYLLVLPLSVTAGDDPNLEKPNEISGLDDFEIFGDDIMEDLDAANNPSSSPPNTHSYSEWSGGSLNEYGALRFTVVREADKSGRHIFRNIMFNFDPLNVHSVEGQWMNLPGMDSNFQSFINAKLTQGLTNTIAATRTWTARMASEFLYNRVSRVDVSSCDISNIHATVSVSFTRSPADQMLAEALFGSSSWLDNLHQDMMNLPSEHELSSNCHSGNDRFRNYQHPPGPPPPPLGGGGMGHLIH